MYKRLIPVLITKIMEETIFLITIMYHDSKRLVDTDGQADYIYIATFLFLFVKGAQESRRYFEIT